MMNGSTSPTRVQRWNLRHRYPVLLLIPLALASFTVVFNVAGLRSLERKIPELTREMNELLGSASANA
jgi:hypothetical protein